MELKLYTLTSEEIQALPIDRLGMIVLEHLVATNQDNAHNFTNDGRNKGIQKETLRCWAEALNWLISHNLVSRDAPGLHSGQAIFVTRLGHRVLKDGIENIKAIERLDLSLHPRLEKVRSQFLIGDYELAAFAAMREVEIQVRELSGLDKSLIGVKLMRKAFGNGGPLEDTDLEAGERHGLMELFAGAIGTFKNPPSHRQVDYADPTEASEVILLSDLLMRLLERYNSRSDEG